MIPREIDVHAGPYGGGPPGYGGPPPGYGGPPQSPPAYGGPPGQGAPPPGGYGPPGQPPGYPPGGGYGPPPNFGPPGFGPGGYAPQMQSGTTDTLAIVSLVMGILSLPIGCCCSIFVLPLSIGGGVCGFISMGNIAKSGGALGGKPLAIVGISLSGVSLVIGLLRLVLGLGMMATQFFK